MVNLSRTLKFQTEAAGHNLQTVMRALEPQLRYCINSVPSIEHIQHRGYFVSSETDSLHNVSADELGDTLAHLSGVNTIMVGYSNYVSPRYRFELWVRNYLSDVVECDCEIGAPNTSEIRGLIETIKNRMDVEIKRQNATEWTTEPLEVPDLGPIEKVSQPSASERLELTKPKLTPSSVNGTSTAVSTKEPKSGFWHTLTTHPLPVSIVSTGVIFILGLAVVKWQPSQSPSPTTTVTVTPSPTAPALTTTSATTQENPPLTDSISAPPIPTQ